MGVQILHDTRNNVACLTCSTSDVAFGPLFSDTDTHDADERAEAFTRWLATANCATFERSLVTSRNDPREFTESGLMAAYTAWLAQEPAQWERERTEETFV